MCFLANGTSVTGTECGFWELCIATELAYSTMLFPKNNKFCKRCFNSNILSDWLLTGRQGRIEIILAGYFRHKRHMNCLRRCEDQKFVMGKGPTDGGTEWLTLVRRTIFVPTICTRFSLPRKLTETDNEMNQAWRSRDETKWVKI